MIYDSEIEFANFLERKGMTWVYEPMIFNLGHTTYRPDFYCPDNNTFYEVVSSRTALYRNALKYKKMIEDFREINFKIVNPDGSSHINQKELFNYCKNQELKQETFNNSDAKNLLDKLNERRLENSLTYEDMAREMDIGTRTFYRWMMGESKPSKFAMRVIKEYLERRIS